MLSDWNYKKIWINPPFTLKFEFLKKAVESYKIYNNDIYILFPIESMTTKKWYETIENTKFKMFIPDYRIGFIVNNIQYRSGAFGIVILKLQKVYDIELLDKGDIINE